MKSQRNTTRQEQRRNPQPGKRRIHPSRLTRRRPVQFGGIIEQMNDGVVVLDKDWHYVYVNAKAAVMLQRQKPSDLIGKHIWTEYPEGVGQPFQLAYEKAMREQIPIVFEDHYEPWDLWFENRIYPSPDSLLILFTEITERKRIEKLLDERQYFLQKILDTEPGTVYIYDLEERRNVYVNRHWLRAYGYTEAETQALGDKLLETIFHTEELARIAAHHESWQQAVENDIREIEYRIRTTQGEWRWVHSREVPFARNEVGKVKQILGISHDITRRKEVEKALRESEEKFSKVFHSSPIPLSINRISDGRYIEANESFLKGLGYQREEVIGHTAKEIGIWAHPQEREHMVRILHDQGSLRGFEGHFRTQSGQIGTALLFRDEIELGGEKYLIGTSLDITERKQMEEALRESEKRYQLISTIASDYMFSSRLNADGKLTLNWVAGAFEAITGYTLEEYIAHGGWRSTLHPDDLAVDDHDLEKLRLNKPVISELRTYTKNGRLVWVRSYAQPILDERTGQLTGIYGAVQDITERKQTEEALASSEAELRVIFSSMKDVVFIIDCDGVYRKIAPTNPSLLYKPPQELLGKTLQDVFPTEQADTFLSTVRQVVQTQQTARIEYQLLVDGEALWFDASISPMEEDTVLWMARDITDRKRAEKDLRQLNEQLEQRIAARTEELAAAMVKAQESDRLKSTFLATMSHELRTPLNSIIGFTSVILQGLAGPLNEEQTKQLNMTRDSARHLLALINDVLDISKIEAGELEILKRPFDMRQAVESVLRVMQPLAEKKKLLLRISIAPDVGVINNDRRRVEQVLINLVSNAIKFSEYGEVRIRCQIRDGWLETSVSDDGIGIQPENMDKLFKPFQQIDTGLARTHEGTGLGLAICKRLVTAMDGEISVESQWNIGSTFKFTLSL